MAATAHGAAGPAFPHLRIWLEPAYDGGRVGAWVLDVPGVFASAPTTGAALTAALTAAARVRSWVEGRGDGWPLPPMGRQEVVAEVPARREPDGYEVNATFAPDAMPLDGTGLERTLRWMAWARDDLGAVADRIAGLEARTGLPLPTDDAAGERSAEAVLRHVAGSEAWLLGRLDPSLRYAGPLHDGDLREVLAASRGWASAVLRDRASGDTGAAVADRHGETWTVAKVARRLVYHGFDHLWELERRVARVDGTAERVAVRLDARPDGPVVAALLRSVGWDVRAADPDGLATAVRESSAVATAWDGERLVGTARLLSDGSLNGLIAMVVVDPRYQGLGVGERLVHALMDGNEHLRLTLAAAPGMEAWYRKLGFAPDPQAMVRPRTRHWA